MREVPIVTSSYRPGDSTLIVWVKVVLGILATSAFWWLLYALFGAR